LVHTAIYIPHEKISRQCYKDDRCKYPITGASDHGVSEAIYLDDPDGNGVELYWDRPKEQWPLDADGNLQMITEHLDLQTC